VDIELSTDEAAGGDFDARIKNVFSFDKNNDCRMKYIFLKN